jgi:hypothetical protein
VCKKCSRAGCEEMHRCNESVCMPFWSCTYCKVFDVFLSLAPSFNMLCVKVCKWALP